MGRVPCPENWDDPYRGEGCPLCGRQRDEAAGSMAEVHGVGAAAMAHFGARTVTYVNPVGPLPKDREVEQDGQLADDADALRRLAA